MNLIERIRGAWAMLAGSEAKATPYTMRTWPTGHPQYTAHNYRNYVQEGYAKSTLVYACIREIAESAAEPRWVVMDGDEPVESDNGLQTLLDAPNPHFSGFELIELTLIHLGIEGNAFWFKERSARGRVVALWPMRPDLVGIVPSKDGDLLGYTYRVGGERVAWLPEDVIHFRYPNPLDELQGLGRGQAPLAVAAREVDVDNAATDFLKQFFENAAVPFGILKSKQQLVESEVRRIRARLREQYTGSRNWHQLMILDADADYQRTGLDMSEMAFPDLRSISESRICMVYGVPPILVGAKVGLDRSTFSNYAEARASFWMETLAPTYRRLQEKINVGLASEFGLRVELDLSSVAALQEDRNALFDRAREAVEGGWGTVNDARREVGWEPVAGGDVFLRPMMVIETPAAPSKARSLALEIKVAEMRGALFARTINRTAAAWENDFEARAQEILRDEEQALRERLARRKGVKAVDWIDLGTDIEQVLQSRSDNWREGFIPLFEGLISDQGDVVAAAFGIDFSLTNPAVQDFIRDYSFRFAERVADTAVETIRSLTATAQDEGWTILQFTDAVTGLYDEWSIWRAEMIARSETIRSSNAGARVSYREAGVLQIEWWTTEDDRRCPFCAEMHGRVINIDDQFWLEGQEMTVEVPDASQRALIERLRPEAWAWSGVEQREAKGSLTLRFNYGDVGYPPLHPMCRCTILPVVD